MLVLRKRAAERAVRRAQSDRVQYFRGKRDEAAFAFASARLMYHASHGGSPLAEEERKRNGTPT